MGESEEIGVGVGLRSARAGEAEAQIDVITIAITNELIVLLFTNAPLSYLWQGCQSTL